MTDAEVAARIDVELEESREDVRAALPPSLADVVFVVTEGLGSMDKYAQRLARHLPVAKLPTDIYERTAELFGAPLLSRASLAGFRRDRAFARALRAVEASLVHLPNHHLGRYGLFLARPYLVTVHDLVRYFDLTGAEPFIHRPNLRDRVCLRLDYAGIRGADAIVAVSETTRRDVIRHLGVPEDRVFVVYEGIDHDLYRPAEGRLLDVPYVLHVGSEQPRKNLETLLRAFALIKRERRFAELRLVKVGRAGGGEAGFRERTLAAVRALGLERDVVFTEFVPEENLPAWYAGAACLVFPSLYEGFGFPPLEAMACGCPAIVADAGSLPEIAGGAALVVPPLDEHALADAIRTVLLDGATARELVARGLARAARFSWERTADETLAVYGAVLARNGK